MISENELRELVNKAKSDKKGIFELATMLQEREVFREPKTDTKDNTKEVKE